MKISPFFEWVVIVCTGRYAHYNYFSHFRTFVSLLSLLISVDGTMNGYAGAFDAAVVGSGAVVVGKSKQEMAGDGLVQRWKEQAEEGKMKDGETFLQKFAAYVEKSPCKI